MTTINPSINPSSIVLELRVSDIPDKKRLLIKKCIRLMKDILNLFMIPLYLISMTIAFFYYETMDFITYFNAKLKNLVTEYGTLSLNDEIRTFNMYIKAKSSDNNEIIYHCHSENHEDLIYLINNNGNYKIISKKLNGQEIYYTLTIQILGKV